MWQKTGAAVETIRNDYGEDLLVQPCLDGKVDAPKVWIQVKGTTDVKSLRRPGGVKKVVVKGSTLFKWIRSVDLTVVVLWDVAYKVGWYAAIDPDQVQMETADLSGSTRSFRVTVAAEDNFNARAARLLGWQSRLSLAATRYRNFVQIAEEERRLGAPAKSAELDAERASLAATRVLLDAMEQLGMIDIPSTGEPVLSKDFLANLDDERRELRASRGRTGKSGPIVLSCLSFTQKRTDGMGLPAPLAIGFASIVHSLIV
jgi:hypothetical protein